MTHPKPKRPRRKKPDHLLATQYELAGSSRPEKMIYINTSLSAGEERMAKEALNAGIRLKELSIVK